MIPITNITTGEISGAEPGSFAYFHEKAHLEFSKSNFGQNMLWIGEMCQFYGLICVVMAWFYTPIKYIALVLVIGMLFIFAYEEIWCNQKAKEMFK